MVVAIVEKEQAIDRIQAAVDLPITSKLLRDLPESRVTQSIKQKLWRTILIGLLKKVNMFGRGDRCDVADWRAMPVRCPRYRFCVKVADVIHAVIRAIVLTRRVAGEKQACAGRGIHRE